MDYQSLFNAAFGLILVGLGWFLNTVYTAVREMEQNIPDTYVRKDDYRVDIQYIRELLTSINEKIDRKQDK